VVVVAQGGSFGTVLVIPSVVKPITLIINGFEQFLFMIQIHNGEGRVMRTKGASMVRRAGTVLRRRPTGDSRAKRHGGVFPFSSSPILSFIKRQREKCHTRFLFQALETSGLTAGAQNNR
jgi:hypothetical protein